MADFIFVFGVWGIFVLLIVGSVIYILINGYEGEDNYYEKTTKFSDLYPQQDEDSD